MSGGRAVRGGRRQLNVDDRSLKQREILIVRKKKKKRKKEKKKKKKRKKKSERSPCSQLEARSEN